MGLVHQASELADRTREDRNRQVDFLRVLAITAVVVGHWMVIDLRLDNGLPVGVNVLTEASWTHWGTWLFQVIPLFFLVGGYANTASWRAQSDRGDDWASWLRRRSVRLLWPTAIFVAVGLILTPLAVVAGVPEAILSQATWAVAIILWFLAVYLAVAALTPISVRAHDRWGLVFAAAMITLVIVNDVVRFTGGISWLAYTNYALVWGAFHQIGIAWHDNTLPPRRQLVVLATIAAVALVGVVVWGPYPVSMVGVPGADVQNTGPPTVALLLLGLAQIGVVLALRRALASWLGRKRVWTVVVAGNLVVMSIFLWHVTPVAIVATIFATLGFTLPGESGSLTWLAFRPLWILLLVLFLIPVILLVRLAERPPEVLESLARRQGRSGLTLTLGLIGIAATSAGLARLTMEGFWAGRPALIPLWGALAFFGGALLAIGAGLLTPRPGEKSK